ncbi:MAG: hypothetical protein IRY95_10790, partial [Clostridia bacterium]|nr:hypothetical protein [Clostridia bacterium]
VRRLASLADGAEREVLLAEWRALLDVMGRLQRVNDDNGRLLQRLVAYGRWVLGVVGAADGGSAWVLDRRG